MIVRLYSFIFILSDSVSSIITGQFRGSIRAIKTNADFVNGLRRAFYILIFLRSVRDVTPNMVTTIPKTANTFTKDCIF